MEQALMLSGLVKALEETLKKEGDMAVYLGDLELITLDDINVEDDEYNECLTDKFMHLGLY